MIAYTVIKKGVNIQHCLNIPKEFADDELEITVRPIRTGGQIRKKIEQLLEKNKHILPFKSVQDASAWQREIRSDW
jgi:hypothetical protein